MTSKISVFGAGSWGTALAIQAARNNNPTLLWGHNPEHMQHLAEDRQNKRYLAGLNFPELLQISSDIKATAEYSDILLGQRSAFLCVFTFGYNSLSLDSSSQ